MIILYNPQSSSNRKPVLPLSLLAIGAVLEGKYDHVIVDGNLESDPLSRLQALISAPSASGPLLALTVMPGPQLQQAVPLCRELKRRFPRLIIVWGGYFPTQHWEACLRSGFVDYVVRGHGELVFLELLNAIAHQPSAIPLRSATGTIVSHQPSAISHIPGLAYHSTAKPDLQIANPQSAIPLRFAPGT